MVYPHIDPVLLHLGPLQIRWYGLMYVIGFITAYFIILNTVRRKHYDLKKEDVEDLLTYCIIGLILGARIGYCFIYNTSYYLHNLSKVIAVWEGGMSFHGGLIGILLAGWIYALRKKKSFWMLTDIGAIAAPLGLFFGRIGNFINGELYGRVTRVPWGMVFPGAGPFPRHPSQLYEAFFEGIILFFIIFRLSKRKLAHGVLFAYFLTYYGVIRFFLEFFRQPDPQLGYILGPFTMGQLLCSAMIIFGTILINKLS